MYMGPIVAESATTLVPATAGFDTVAVTRRRPSTPLARRIAGVPMLAFAAMVMLPWFAFYAVVAAAVLGARGLIAAPRALVDAVDYAGKVALGR